jgi:glycosyltransferase involved in cell wall biosynthesis
VTKTISSSIGYHCGGLGQHLSQFVEDTRAAAELGQYFAPVIKTGDDAHGVVVRQRLAPLLLRWSPARFDAGWRWHLDCDLWDRKIAARLVRGMDCFVSFGGMALRSFRAARKLGCQRLELIAANSHVDNCFRLHAKAAARDPVETSWLNDAHRRKTLAEYAMADTIWIASEYAREVFVREGVPESKLKRIHYTTDPRYTPRPPLKSDGVFRVVYVGALSVAKGIPLLLDAFARFNDGPAELTLIGGSSTRGMRKYLAARLARDSRVRLAPGDPLPHLHKADVCVHPSWEDNLAYAALEALRAGVPVVVSADTGMKEYVVEGENGFIVPTGDAGAIYERLVHLARKR